MGRSALLLLLFAAATGIAPAAGPTAPARHVVLVVFDGMRPDFVRAETTPNLWALAQRGVFFANHHAVYLSSTEVNGTAMATGLMPGHNGIVANREYRPALDALRSFDTQTLEFVDKGDALTKGKYLGGPTIAALVQSAGFRTVVAGTKGVALLHDRPGGRRAATEPASVDLYVAGTRERAAGSGEAETYTQTIPVEAAVKIQESVGSIPGRITYPNEAQDAWTTTAVLDELWKNDVPMFSTIWLSEPDYTQHQYGPGSEQALAAIRSSDRNLGRVIETLRARGALERTDILVVSDHGFSTIERPLDVAALLREGGFDAAREFRTAPTAGQIMVVGNSGSVLLYVAGHDVTVARKLVDHLQTTDYAGAIFAREKFDGAFTLNEGGLDSADAPDILFSLQWGDGANQFGVPGTIFSDGRRPKGAGTHASLSRFDQHNTLVAAGPDFRAGFRCELPTGNIDLAPTILHVLGIAPQKMDGRIMVEALRQSAGAAVQPGKAHTERIERVNDFEKSRWRQYLQITRYGGSIYLDEGGATRESK